MDLKISNSKNAIVENGSQIIKSTNALTNDEFMNVLNAYIIAADECNSLDQISLDSMTQNNLTLRCLLGSINLPKYSDTVDYTQTLGSYGLSEQSTANISGTSQVIARTISSLFEGGTVAGNFDGQGLSLGYLQWNIGTGSLQPLLQQMATGADTKDDFNRIFAQKISVTDSAGRTVTRTMADEIRRMLQMNHTDQLNWAKSINNSNDKIVEPWKTAFHTLTANEDFKGIEDTYAKSYFNKAQSIVNDSEIGVKTVRGYTLAFDIAVQNGSVKSSAKNLIVDALAGKSNKLTNPNDASLTKNQRDIVVDLNKRLQGVTDTDTRKLYYTAAAVAISAKDKYAKDVWSRKSTIVSGSGVVHGKNYAFHNSGLSDNALA